MPGIVVGTFVLTMVIVFGSYWAFVGRIEGDEALRLRRRLQTNAVEITRMSLVAQETPLSEMPWFNRLLSHLRGGLDPLRSMIARAGLSFTPGAVLLACGFLALLAFTLVRRLVPPAPALALIAAVVAAGVPLGAVWAAARRRMRQFEEGFPAAIDLIARALRAGHALTSAIEVVGTEIPDPIGAEFRLIFERRNYGMSLEDALRGLAARVPLIDARFLVTAVLTQREVGGNLAEVLENLARVIRERFSVRREIRIASAHGRLTGWVLGLLVPIMAFILFGLYPKQMMVLVTDPIGIRLALAAIGLEVVGVFFIRRLVNIEY